MSKAWRTVIAGFVLLLSGSAWAAAPGIINYYNAVCDPNYPTRCVAPTAAGVLPIGGYEFNVGTATTVQNAAYAAGQSLGGLQTVSVGATGGLSGILTGIQIGTGGGMAYGNLTVYVWSKNPANTTCTDKTNFVASAADNTALLNGTPVNVSLATVAAAQDTGLYGNASNLVAPFVNGSANTDLYVCILATASVTPASTTGPRFNLSGIKDQP